MEFWFRKTPAQPMPSWLSKASVVYFTKVTALSDENIESRAIKRLTAAFDLMPNMDSASVNAIERSVNRRVSMTGNSSKTDVLTLSSDIDGQMQSKRLTPSIQD